MTQPLDLNAITRMHRAQDIDTMANEIRRLRIENDRLATRLAKEERLHGETIDDRDHFHDMADKLAYAVAPVEVIGEHSSMNCPWDNALDLITPKAEVDKLRAGLATAREQAITDVGNWLDGIGEKAAAYLVRTLDIPAAEETHVVADDKADR